MVNLNARVCTKILELPRNELSPIISYNVIGNSKHIHDFFDEFHCLDHCNGSDRIYFDPLVNLSTTMKMCVNPPLAFLKGPTKSSPHVEKGQVIGMVCSWWDDTYFWQAKNWQLWHWRTKESASDTTVGQKNPCIYALPMRDLAPKWLPQIPAWMSCSIAHPSSGVIHLIRVSLAPGQKSSSFTRVYYLVRWHSRSRSSLSSRKHPVLRNIMNGVCQSE
jgi:hypothetical protein